MIKVTRGIDTLGKKIRFWSVYQTINSSIKSFPNYNVAECGCFKGFSTYIIAKILEKNNFSKKFYIFDSFEGLSPLSDQDLMGLDNATIKEGTFKCSEINFRKSLLQLILKYSSHLYTVCKFSFQKIGLTQAEKSRTLIIKFFFNNSIPNRS